MIAKSATSTSNRSMEEQSSFEKYPFAQWSKYRSSIDEE